MMYTLIPTGLGVVESIQAAIDALPDEGGMLMIAPGAYSLTAPLDLSGKSVILQGSGVRSTWLAFAFSAADSCVKVIGAPASVRVAIRDLAIVGDGETTENGILLADSSKHAFENVLIEGVTGAGVRGDNFNSQNLFSNVQVWNSAGYGFKMFGAANRYVGCIASRSTGLGVGGLSAFRSQETGGAYWGCTADGHTIGFELAGYAEGVCVHGLHAERCGQNIRIAGSVGMQPKGCSFYGGMALNSQDPALASIGIASADSITLSGLLVRGSASGKGISVAEPVTSCVLLNSRCEDAIPYDAHPNADVTIIR